MKILIAGLGLIGGSFALALRDRGIADEILGVEKSDENAAEALRLGLADRIVTLEEGVPQADLVVLATPVDTIPLMAVKALNHVTDRQVVMDMGSIKAELCEVISMHARRGRFVAAHPMWGTEYSGPRAAQHGAFTGRNAVLCEAERSDADALATVERIFRTLDVPVVYMGAEEHDLHAAYVSHISHVTSFALALTVLEKEREERHIFDLAGGGFESTVRLAKSAAATWVPILLRNKYNVLDVLREHIHQLQIMRRMIERDDAEGLTSAFVKLRLILRLCLSSAWSSRTCRRAWANARRRSFSGAQGTKFARSTGGAAATSWTSWPARGISCTSWRSRPDVRTDSRRPKRP